MSWENEREAEEASVSIPPESIHGGKCYLTGDYAIRRVVMIHPDGRIQYEWRAGHRKKWKVGILTRREFAIAAEREVPCDWTPETDA